MSNKHLGKRESQEVTDWTAMEGTLFHINHLLVIIHCAKGLPITGLGRSNLAAGIIKKI